MKPRAKGQKKRKLAAWKARALCITDKGHQILAQIAKGKYRFAPTRGDVLTRRLK